jgi:restriction endonuclease S subunit
MFGNLKIGGGSIAIHAALDTHQFYTFASINNLLLRQNSGIAYKYLLALLNSRLLNWYYVENFTNRSELTVNISRTYLDQLPIVVPPNKLQEEIMALVDQILSAKNSNQKANTNILEHQIDQLVYQLYGLTSEEIAIVEGNNK